MTDSELREALTGLLCTALAVTAWATVLWWAA